MQHDCLCNTLHIECRIDLDANDFGSGVSNMVVVCMTNVKIDSQGLCFADLMGILYVHRSS